MSWLDDVGNWFSNLTGNTGSQQANAAQAQGSGLVTQGGTTLQNAAGEAQGIAGVSPAQFAQQEAAAGTGLGNQMGAAAADVGTQKAMQAARTAGVNKGQAALAGGAQAANAFTGGQTAGQQLGMGAYGQGANTQLGAVNAQTGAGASQGNIGANVMNTAAQQQAQGAKQGGGFLGSVLGAVGLEKGGVVTKPTSAVVGEKGPEVVLPLNDKERTAQILEKIGFKKGAAEARSMKCPTCGGDMKGKINGSH